MKKKKFQPKDYPFTVRPLSAAEGGGYGLTFPDLPGCVADGETLEEAIKNGHDAAQSWLKTAQHYGDTIPAPSEAQQHYSGRWVMRVPKWLHRVLALQADQQGVSLNQFATSLLSHGVARGHSH